MSEASGSILIVDDEFSVRDSLSAWFRSEGYRTGTAADGQQALELFEQQAWDLVLLDIRMPGMTGLELQRRLHQIDPDAQVIIVTAFASVATAVEAMKAGAFEYVTKPVDPDELSALVGKALDQRRLKSENTQLRSSLKRLWRLDDVVGESAPMKRVAELVRQVAETDATVLVRGDSGTGKELIAQAIHVNSRRRFFPMIAVSCGALSESLLESELFGHEKGAFTGAQQRHRGKLELADRGTLFLDEIGTISAKTQVELLRVIETREFTRLGGQRPVQVDFRVIAATNENLEQAVAAGTFREDLYYRLNVFTIELPPLRERRDDIPLLARHFLDRYSRQMNKPIGEISPDAMDMLVRAPWPGNVRELANAIERAMVLGRPPALLPGDLPRGLAEPRPTVPVGDSLAEVERAHIARVLDDLDWNISQASRKLDIDRGTLYNKIKKYGLKR